jgi:hypothetical protein
MSIFRKKEEVGTETIMTLHILFGLAHKMGIKPKELAEALIDINLLETYTDEFSKEFTTASVDFMMAKRDESKNDYRSDQWLQLRS